VMTTPLLEGLNGIEKMSKSLGNYVGVTEPAAEMFGKLMSISDDLMWRYYLLLTDLSEPEIDNLQKQVAAGVLHPKNAKADLARRIVTEFHSAEEADRAAQAFEARFGRGEVTEADLAEVRIRLPAGESIGIAKLVAEAGLAVSTSEASRKIQQGGVRVDGVRVSSVKDRVDSTKSSFVLEVGRRAVRVIFPGDLET
jgi:tyrosyl-tRNA synthetase